MKPSPARATKPPRTIDPLARAPVPTLSEDPVPRPIGFLAAETDPVPRPALEPLAAAGPASDPLVDASLSLTTMSLSGAGAASSTHAVDQAARPVAATPGASRHRDVLQAAPAGAADDDDGAAAYDAVARALHEAAGDGLEAVVESMLDAGAPPDAVWPLDDETAEPASPAGPAVGSAPATPDFARADASPRAADPAARAADALRRGALTPLLRAAAGGHAPVVRLLLARGARPDPPGGDGFAPLRVAARRGFAEVARLLLDAGADPNGTCALVHGRTALMRSCFPGAGADPLGCKAVRAALLGAGADPNIQNEWGETALILAGLRGDKIAIVQLLQHGANAALCNSDGATAGDALNSPKLVEYIKRAAQPEE
jgi:hypothetical protein